MGDVFDDLEAEYAAFDATLDALAPADWSIGTLCAGWDVRDLVCHLWIQAEVAIASIAGDDTMLPSSLEELPELDARIDASVRARRDVPGAAAWERWRETRSDVVDQLRALEPATRIRWTVASLAPRTLATVLLMEAWTHAYDVRAPLGLSHDVTGRTRHLAWFAWKTLPFAFRMAGEEPAPVRFELDAPGGDTWKIGPQDASDVVRGSALELCLRSVARLDLDDAETLRAEGRAAEAALRVVRCFP